MYIAMRLYKQKHVTSIWSCNIKHMITTESIWQEEVCEDFFVEVFPILVTCVGLAKIDIHIRIRSCYYSMCRYEFKVWTLKLHTYQISTWGCTGAYENAHQHTTDRSCHKHPFIQGFRQINTLLGFYIVKKLLPRLV